MAGGIGAQSELLAVLGDVKARVQDKLHVEQFPMPQFILIGKQSVGKSRLIEALAGQTFNFISGTLGSRRPTVLEFRNLKELPSSRWYVRDRETSQWNEHPIDQVMKIIGNAHEELGENVSEEPVYVRIESPHCVDMQIVDLPGFRDFAMDEGKKLLGQKIEALVEKFMGDSRNVMLCVEQAGDAATMSTLARCRKLDPEFKRTVLIRNKLDKYYTDLTPENVEDWMRGHGDLPEGLMQSSYTMTLPWWQDGMACPKPFHELTQDKNQTDVSQMQQKGLSPGRMQHVGFTNFVKFMDKKVEQMFSDALDPVMRELKSLDAQIKKTQQDTKIDLEESNPSKILTTTRDCGKSFAKGLVHIMSGVIDKDHGVTMAEELGNFHAHHAALGSDHFMMLPIEDFKDVPDYIDYLGSSEIMDGFDVPLSGGSQFRRVLQEVEIFLRFSEVASDTKKKDVVQARGVSMTSLTWRDVVVKLLSAEAHLPLQQRVQYVGERITWFFESQKNFVLDWMLSLEHSPNRHSYDALLVKHSKLIANNSMMQMLIFEAYDRACRTQMQSFIELFQNMLTSTFANPWSFLKGGTGSADCGDGDEGRKRFASRPEERIPQEMQSRSGIESDLNIHLQGIPTDSHQIDDAVDKVQILVMRIYGLIRSQVCDQVELFAESFFKCPMLRHLDEYMANIELNEQNKEQYAMRRERLEKDLKKADSDLVEVKYCIDKLDDFKIRCETVDRFRS